LELIGATFLLIFAFALLIIAGVVFFSKIAFSKIEEFNRNIMPPKPKKLTLIFSKKRSEIMQQTGVKPIEPSQKTNIA